MLKSAAKLQHLTWQICRLGFAINSKMIALYADGFPKAYGVGLYWRGFLLSTLFMPKRAIGLPVSTMAAIRALIITRAGVVSVTNLPTIVAFGVPLLRIVSW